MTQLRNLLLFLILVLAISAEAYYVIPYELRLGTGAKQQRYTVLVVLADHYDHHFGEQDGLTQALAQNFHPDSKVFLDEYLKVPYQWYLEQFAKNPAAYGDEGGRIAEGLKQFESIANGRSSAVIITEHNNLNKVLAFARVDTADPNGLLSSENHFLTKGLNGERFTAPKLDFTWSGVSDFRPEAYQTEFHKLAYPVEDRQHFWLEGENVELKNFAIDKKAMRKFFRPLFLIARQHKMFDWGAKTFPKELTTWPDGSAIPEEARERFGVRASHVWLDAYSDYMKSLYESMGFKVWKTINNEHTHHRDLHFMYAPVRDFDRSTQDKVLTLMSKDESWLVSEKTLSGLLQRANCVDDLIKLAPGALPAAQ